MIRFRAMSGLDFHANRRRTNLFEMCHHSFADVFGFLIGNKSAGDFGPRPRRHDGLAAFALITAREAAGFERGPRAALLGGSKTAFAEQFGRAGARIWKAVKCRHKSREW